MIRQMVGRANRAQGVAYGRVFILATNVMKAETDLAYVEAKDKLRNNDIGSSIIHWLLDKYIAMVSQDRTVLFEIFCGQKWRMTTELFHKQHASVKQSISPYLE